MNEHIWGITHIYSALPCVRFVAISPRVIVEETQIVGCVPVYLKVEISGIAC